MLRWRGGVRTVKSETQKILKQALKYQVKIGDERAFKLLGSGRGAEVRQGRRYIN